MLASFAYDDLGRRTSLTRGSGGVTSYGFDAASRLSSLTQNPAGTADDLANGFAYNPASQIASETTTNAAYDWTHPANFTNAYASDLLNKYVTAAGATLTHDSRGNLTFDGAKTFAYDAANRLVSASGGGVSATLKYDPASRLYEVAGTATTRFLYDGADIIAEYDGSGTLLRRHAHGPGADEPLVWYEGSTTADRRFLHADPRGSVIAVANSSGTITAKNKYDAYGAPAAGNQGRFQYTGQIWLAEAGLYHYKARAYHPGLGRFLQTDPIGYGDGLNLYAYVGNDPVNATDPSGLYASGCASSRLASTCERNGFPLDSGYSGGGGGGGGGGGSGGGGTPVVCVDNECTPQTVFVPGSSTGSDNGDEIVVSATRSRTHEFLPSGAFSAWDTFGGENEFRGFLGAACYNEACSDGINDLTVDMVLLAAGGPLVRGLSFFLNRAIGAMSVNALIKAGNVVDRGGLTRAGRALAKHGGREGSVFSRPIGNPTAINQQGQAALENILRNVSKTSRNKFGGLDYYGGNLGGGARFGAQGNFIGFLEP